MKKLLVRNKYDLSERVVRSAAGKAYLELYKISTMEG